MRLLRNEPTYFLARTLWQYTRDVRGRVWFYITFSAIGGSIWTLQPALFAKLLNTIQTGGGIHAGNQQAVVLIIAGLLLVDLVAWFFHGTARVVENGVAFHAYQSYKRSLLSGIFSLPVSWHSAQDTGKIIDKVGKATDALYAFGRNTFQIIHFFVRIVITGAIFFWFNWWIALITTVLMIASFTISFLFDLRITKIISNLQRIENEVAKRVVDSITNVLSVKILHIEKPVLRGIVREMKEETEPSRAFFRTTELKWFTGGMIFSTINLIPLFVYAWIVYVTGMVFEIGTFTALYLYASNLINVYYTFNSEYEAIMHRRTRIGNIADIEDAIAAFKKPERRAVADWKQLSIRDVRFTYGDSERAHVSVDKLTIRRGEKIALLGGSGSGKTTFLKVLHGLYDDAVGQYTVNGSSWKQTTFADIDLQSMMVPQEPEVFSSTIRENITLGQEYDDVAIAEAANIARFSDVIEQLPEGLESVVNEKGVNLSGGQKQRLALARALLFAQEKELLLLDESTSSVDPTNEAHIYEAIMALWEKYTVIATIHKLNLLKYFDRIIIFEQGSIIDDGNFDELMQRNQSFRKQWEEFVAYQIMDSK